MRYFVAGTVAAAAEAFAIISALRSEAVDYEPLAPAHNGLKDSESRHLLVTYLPTTHDSTRNQMKNAS